MNLKGLLEGMGMGTGMGAGTGAGTCANTGWLSNATVEEERDYAPGAALAAGEETERTPIPTERTLLPRMKTAVAHLHARALASARHAPPRVSMPVVAPGARGVLDDGTDEIVTPSFTADGDLLGMAPDGARTDEVEELADRSPESTQVILPPMVTETSTRGGAARREPEPTQEVDLSAIEEIRSILDAGEDDDPGSFGPVAMPISVPVVHAVPAPGLAPARAKSGNTVRVPRAEVEHLVRRTAETRPAAQPMTARASRPEDDPAVAQLIEKVRDEEGKRRRHDVELALRAERERATRARLEMEERYREQIVRLETDLVEQIERLRGRIDDGAPTAPKSAPLPLPPEHRARSKSYSSAVRAAPAPAHFHDDEEVPTGLTKESLDPPTGTLHLPPATPASEMLAAEVLPWESPPEQLVLARADSLQPRKTAGDWARDAMELLSRPGGMVAAFVAVTLLVTATVALVAGGRGGRSPDGAGALASAAAAEAVDLDDELGKVRAALDVSTAAADEVAAERDAEDAAALAGASAGAVAGARGKATAGVKATGKVKSGRAGHKGSKAKYAKVRKTPASVVVGRKLAALDEADRRAAVASSSTEPVASEAPKARKPRPGEPLALDLLF